MVYPKDKFVEYLILVEKWLIEYKGKKIIDVVPNGQNVQNRNVPNGPNGPRKEIYG